MYTDYREEKDARDPDTYKVIGACMAVHSKLGSGFLEIVYKEALEIEFALCRIPAEREVEFSITYRDTLLRSTFVADFVCFGSVLFEAKALERLVPANTAQVLNYLKASGLRKALLVNFGAPSLEYKRFVL